MEDDNVLTKPGWEESERRLGEIFGIRVSVVLRDLFINQVNGVLDH